MNLELLMTHFSKRFLLLAVLVTSVIQLHHVRFGLILDNHAVGWRTIQSNHALHIERRVLYIKIKRNLGCSRLLYLGADPLVSIQYGITQQQLRFGNGANILIVSGHHWASSSRWRHRIQKPIRSAPGAIDISICVIHLSEAQDREYHSPCRHHYHAPAT